MTNWLYRYHGLTVRSDINLPEWSAFEISSGADFPFAADVAIGQGEAEAPVERGEREYRFLIKQTGWFIVRNGNEIRHVPIADSPGQGFRESDAMLRRMRAFLLGSAWGALMYQRGALVIHASAVRVGSGAVAFCGRRGVGKSTLAAMLSELRYPLISDDFCCVRTSPDAPPLLYPSVPRFRLCEDAIVKLGWSAVPEHREHIYPGKYQYLQGNSDREGLHPLLRIYVLGWGPSVIHRLRGFNAVTRLISAGTWRGDVLLAAGDPAGHFKQYADLLGTVECWDYRRPRDLSLLAESTAELMEHISSNQKSAGCE